MKHQPPWTNMKQNFGRESNIGEILVIYAGLMEEIKVRVDILREVSSLNMHKRVAYELGQLLVRLICEDIALACLVAHGDLEVSKSKKLRKAYQPSEIMKALEAAHTYFYPQAGRQKLNEHGFIVGALPYEGPHLSKEKLIARWGRAGNDLHRGSVENLLNVTTTDFNSLSEFAQEVRALLEFHQIALLDGTTQIWTLMSEATTGRVDVRLMTKIGTSTT